MSESAYSDNPWGDLAAVLYGEGRVHPRRSDEARLGEVDELSQRLTAISYSANAAANYGPPDQRAYHQGRVVVLRECARLLSGIVEGIETPSRHTVAQLQRIHEAHSDAGQGTCRECGKPSPCPTARESVVS